MDRVGALNRRRAATSGAARRACSRTAIATKSGDGSVFVTGGAVNPTATICALALRFSKRIVAERRNLAVAA